MSCNVAAWSTFQDSASVPSRSRRTWSSARYTARLNRSVVPGTAFAPIASSGKQFEEFAPKKQLEQNSDRDRQAQLPPPQPEETQQANRARRHDIPPTHADQSQRAEGGSPPSRVTPQGADAVVRAMSTEAAAEEEALALAPAEDAEQDA